MKKYAILFISLLMLSSTGATQTTKKKMTLNESLFMPSWGSYTLSPDGEKIAFTQQHRDTADYSTKSHIHIYNIVSGEMMRLTNSEKGESNPEWLPDGRLIFTSHRENPAQVWVISLKGGEAVPFFDDAKAPERGIFSPDYRRMVYTKKSNRLDQNASKKPKNEKDDAYYAEHKLSYTHIWIYDIETRKHTQLTTKNFDNAGPAWSADGRWIAFSSNRTSTYIGDPNRSDNSDIWIVPSDSGAVRRLTTNKGPDRGPVWSPDGRWIAYSGSVHENSQANQYDVMVIPFQGGQSINLTADFDYSTSGIQWSKDGKTIYFTAAQGLTSHLFKVPSRGGPVKKVISGDEYVYGGYFGGGFQMSADGKRWLFTGSSLNSPGEVFLADINGKNIKNIISPTHHMKDFHVATSEVVSWQSTDGWEIKGILTYPIDYKKGQKVPLILMVHGGPHGRYTKAYNSSAEIWAARGYAVLRGNCRGSSGRTFAFSNANSGDWGGGDYIDYMKGVDYVISMGVADPEKLAVMGGSYGGYMTFWIVTQTDRFKAAIGHAAISNWFSFYGVSGMPQLTAYGMGGLPWETPQNYQRSSPLKHASNVKTPLLITHGDEDYNVRITQAEEFYRYLKKMGKVVEFLRFPREGHGIREPRHRLFLDQEQAKWFKKYLFPEQ